MSSSLASFPFLSNHPATTEIYTLSLHDALPICGAEALGVGGVVGIEVHGRARRLDGLPAAAEGDEGVRRRLPRRGVDRKSTRLNSSHVEISYAVFCLKKKKKKHRQYAVKHRTEA